MRKRKERCDNCKYGIDFGYWGKTLTEDGDGGLCKRYPPYYMHGEKYEKGETWGNPVVFPESFCGEWKAK